MPKVSVLMSVRDGERYLREAVESILNQSFTGIEFIVIDDGSSDRTPTVLDSYTDPRIVRLHNPQSLGLTLSLNRGLTIARGEFIARQDADDISLPDRLAQQVAYLDEHPSCGLVGTAYAVIDADGLVQREVHPPCANEALQAELWLRNPFSHGSSMCRRAALEQAGGYRPQFRRSQDYDLWLRLAEGWQVANLSHVLYHWRHTPDNITSRYALEQARDALRAVQDAYARRAAKAESLSLAAKRGIALQQVRVATLLYAADQDQQGQDQFREAFRWAPELGEQVEVLADHMVMAVEAVGLNKAEELARRLTDGVAAVTPAQPGLARRLHGHLLLRLAYAWRRNHPLARHLFLRSIRAQPRLGLNQGMWRILFTPQPGV